MNCLNKKRLKTEMGQGSSKKIEKCARNMLKYMTLPLFITYLSNPSDLINKSWVDSWLTSADKYSITIGSTLET